MLPPAPPRLRSGGETADEALQAGKAQAAVVGSELVSFATHVAPQWRQDLINCSLFAQLWAKAEVADPKRIFDWYDAYFGALQQLGWMVQDQGFAVYVETSQNFSAHDAILKVAEGLLMPSMG
jgi:predicted naringenin-chalcone synthase